MRRGGIQVGRVDHDRCLGGIQMKRERNEGRGFKITRGSYGTSHSGAKHQNRGFRMFVQEAANSNAAFKIETIRIVLDRCISDIPLGIGLPVISLGRGEMENS